MRPMKLFLGFLLAFVLVIPLRAQLILDDPVSIRSILKQVEIPMTGYTTNAIATNRNTVHVFGAVSGPVPDFSPIFYARSTDGGISFEKTRTIGRGFTPMIREAMAKNGTVAVVWTWVRDQDMVGPLMHISHDDGETFTGGFPLGVRGCS